MHSRNITKYISLLCSLLLVLSISGVFAGWIFTVEHVEDVSKEIPLKMGDFLWDGSGDLPTDSEVGENHLTLIEQIVNHPQHGLNTSGSYLNDQIKDRQDGGIGWRNGRDTLGSMAVTQSSELNEIFGLDASNLTFLIQFKSNTEYYLFTTGVDLGERGTINFWGNNSIPGKPTVPIGNPVFPIYRTTIQKVDGVWAAVETKEGYALSAWYEESRSNANATQIPSFDPDTFTEGEPTT